MAKTSNLLRLAPLLLALAVPVRALDGVLDSTFGGDGIVFWTGGESVTLGDAVALPGGDLVGVGTYETTTTEPRLHWQRFADDGAIVITSGCSLPTATLFPLSTESHGNAALVDSSGNLLVGGWLAVQFSANQSRALVARFALDETGCVLDTTYSDTGFEFFDDESFCDVEDCEILDLAEIRPATGAVAEPRVVALLESHVDNSFSALYLLGLDASGAIDTGFGVGGYRQLTGFLLGGLLSSRFSGSRIAVDRRGRIYLVTTRHDPVATSDEDLVLARFTADGDLDATYGDDGVRIVLGSDAENDYGRDLAALPDDSILVLAQRGSSSRSVLARDNGADGSFTFVHRDGVYAGAVAVTGEGKTLQAYDPQGSDGGGLERRTAAGVLDSAFGSGGSTTFDLDLGGANTEHATVLLLSGGRPVLAGTADRTATRTAGFFVRMTSALVFADGFEAATPAAWSAAVP